MPRPSCSDALRHHRMTCPMRPMGVDIHVSWNHYGFAGTHHMGIVDAEPMACGFKNRFHGSSRNDRMPSETSHVWLRTPCASIFFAPQIAKGAASPWNNPAIRPVSCFRCFSRIFFLPNIGRGVCGSGSANPCSMGNGQVSLRCSAIAAYAHRRNGNSPYDEGVRRLPRR